MSGKATPDPAKIPAIIIIHYNSNLRIGNLKNKRSVSTVTHGSVNWDLNLHRKQYVKNMVEVFREVKRVLKPEGTLWLNIGDSYCAGSRKSGVADSAGGDRGLPTTQRNQASGDLKQKDLVGIPWMLAFALRADGWYLRQDIIWAKPNCMPESVRDRCTKKP